MQLVRLQTRCSLSINDVLRITWICYSPKRDILDYWETLIFCLLSYYILSKDTS